MPEVLESLHRLPVGSHALSLHSSRSEAQDHAVDFLAGTPGGQSASYWVPSADLATAYELQLGRTAPDHIGCVQVLPTEQVEAREGRLRPVSSVFAFIQAHPEGVSAGGETISQYWNAANLEAHLEYEAWFEQQPRATSRFVCPYDLRRIPSEHPEAVLRALGSHHSHVVLSRSADPAVRLLQLFLFPYVRDLPPLQETNLGWALRTELVALVGSPSELDLTRRGDDVVREWSDRAVLA